MHQNVVSVIIGEMQNVLEHIAEAPKKQSGVQSRLLGESDIQVEI